MTQTQLRLAFLKRALTDSLGPNHELTLTTFFHNGRFPDDEFLIDILADTSGITPERLIGLDHPQRAMTMIGLKRMDNIEVMLDYIRENNIEGDLIETGAWRGGACIFMKWYCQLYKMDKKVFVADSFAGLPRPNAEKYPADAGDIHHIYAHLAVSLEQVKDNFSLYLLNLDKSIVFLKGWFSETLPGNTYIGKLAMLRMDGDMYESTMDVFNALYDKVTDKGVVIIDDYNLTGCRKAVDDFRNTRDITAKITNVDDRGHYWFK